MHTIRDGCGMQFVSGRGLSQLINQEFRGEAEVHTTGLDVVSLQYHNRLLAGHLRGSIRRA